MDENPAPQIWHALTPPGVARFAGASFLRMLLTQLFTAVFVSGCVIWFYAVHVSPVVSAAIKQLPETARLSNGKLQDVPAELLAEGRFLSVSAGADGTIDGGTGDIHVHCGETMVTATSLFGPLELPYPAVDLSLARSELEPWWGAWQTAIYAGITVAVTLHLFVTWTVLGWIYCAVPKLLAFFTDKQLSWKGSRRLCAAAQLLGAILAGICIVLYGIGMFDLARFLFFFAAHLVVDWAYVIISPFFLAQVSSGSAPGANPFAGSIKEAGFHGK